MSRFDPDYVTHIHFFFVTGRKNDGLAEVQPACSQGATLRRAFAMYQHLQVRRDTDYGKAVFQIRFTRHAEACLRW